jgi:hypothetical protein
MGSITWTEYPDDKARRESRDGVKRQGQVWSPGPQPGTRWVIPYDQDTTLYVLVHTRQGVKGLTANYSVKGEAA